MDRTKTNDVAELTKLSLKTFLNIALMTQYQMRYAQKGDVEDKEKMYIHAFFAGVGIVSLLTIGVLGLMESQKTDNRIPNSSW